MRGDGTIPDHTNVVSDYFAENLTEPGLQFIDRVVNAIPNLSIITQLDGDLLAYHNKGSLLRLSPRQQRECIFSSH